MKTNDCFSIGYFTKTHGYKGGLTAKLAPSFLELIEQVEFVYLEVAGTEVVPFFIENVSVLNNGKATVNIEDITTEKEAKVLVGKALLLAKSDYPDVSQYAAETDDLKGYLVVDDKEGEIGKVEEVLEQQAQDILLVLDGENEILIPFVPEIVIEIDSEKKEISVNLPEGLLDIYR